MNSVIPLEFHSGTYFRLRIKVSFISQQKIIEITRTYFFNLNSPKILCTTLITKYCDKVNRKGVVDILRILTSEILTVMRFRLDESNIEDQNENRYLYGW